MTPREIALVAHAETLMGDGGSIHVNQKWIRVEVNRGSMFSSYTWSRGPGIEDCLLSVERQVDLVIGRIEKGFGL
jgi:hypothetical protein